MQANQEKQEKAVQEVYKYAANLMADGSRTKTEVKLLLTQQGLDESSAAIVVNNLAVQISSAEKKRAQKDMLYGALWCVGGIIATMANIGFIFWGAIVFGAIQFIKGAANS